MNQQGNWPGENRSSGGAYNYSRDYEDIYKRAPGFGNPQPPNSSGNSRPPRDWKTILAVTGICLVLLVLLGVLGYTVYGWFLSLPDSSEKPYGETDIESGRQEVLEEEEKENKEQETETPEEVETPPEEETVEEEEAEKEEIDTSPYIAGQIDAGSYKDHTYAIYHLDRLPRAIESYGELSSYIKNWDAHLLTIDNADENYTIFRFLMENHLATAFFGYSDEIQEAVWLWDDGSSGNYTNWSEYNEQPNNGKFNEKEKWKNEDYAEFMLETNDGSWNDAPFGINTRYFIVEWDKFDPSLKSLE